MPNETHNEVEKLLRRYAEQRRAQAEKQPFELHPATRQMLLSEAARQYPSRPAANQKPAFLAVLALAWPRLGWALGIFAALCVVTYSVILSNRPPSQGPDLARNNARSTTLPAVASETNLPEPKSEESPGEAQALAISPGLATGDHPAPTGADNRLAVAPALAKPAERDLARKAPDPSDAPASTSVERPLAEKAPEAMAVKKAESQPSIGSRALRTTTPVVYATEPAGRAAPSQNPELPERSRSQPAPFAFDPAAKTQGITEYYFASQARSGQPDAGAFGAPMIAQRASPSDALQANDRADGQTVREAVPPPAQPTDRGEARGGLSRASAVATSETPDQANAAGQYFGITASAPRPASQQDGSPARQTVLATFELQQDGSRIRIIDVDGSVYEGNAELERLAGQQKVLFNQAAPERRAETKQRETEPGNTRKLGERTEKDGYMGIPFQVSGTSRRLGQPVTINGTLYAAVPTVLPVVQKAPPDMVVDSEIERRRMISAPVARGMGRGNPPPAISAPATPRVELQPAPARSAPPAADDAAIQSASSIERIEAFIRVGSGPDRLLEARALDRSPGR